MWYSMKWQKKSRNHRQKIKSYCSQSNPEGVIVDNLPKLGKEIHVDTGGIQKRKWPCLEKNTICHITVVALNIQKNIKAETEKYKVTLEVAQKKCTLPSNLEKPEGNDSYEIEKY